MSSRREGSFSTNKNMYLYREYTSGPTEDSRHQYPRFGHELVVKRVPLWEQEVFPTIAKGIDALHSIPRSQEKSSPPIRCLPAHYVIVPQLALCALACERTLGEEPPVT